VSLLSQRTSSRENNTQQPQPHEYLWHGTLGGLKPFWSSCGDISVFVVKRTQKFYIKICTVRALALRFVRFEFVCVEAFLWIDEQLTEEGLITAIDVLTVVNILGCKVVSHPFYPEDGGS
jgi:hypothetical protein